MNNSKYTRRYNYARVRACVWVGMCVCVCVYAWMCG